MTKKKKQTAGEMAAQALANPTPTTVFEQREAMRQDYMDNIVIALEEGKKKYTTGDIYVVHLLKAEQLLPNMFRDFFFARATCPTPNYDQTVFKYTRASDKLELLWVIPDRDVCLLMLAQSSEIPPDQWQLLKYVIEFQDRTLYKLARTLNNERDDVPQGALIPMKEAEIDACDKQKVKVVSP